MSQKKLSGLGLKIFEQRYSYPGEKDYSDRCKAMAKHMSSVEADDKKDFWYDKFYDSLSSGDLIPGGRIIFGSGRTRQNLLNCYAIQPEDSVESIGKTIQDMYRISCGGGGIGFNFSNIRPKGDDIGNIKNSAPGAVSVMQMINEVGNHVKAGKNRRTALMAELNVEHPDLLEFLYVKLDKHLLTNFNISVAINDDFIKACEDGKEWTFKFNSKEYFVFKVNKVSPDGTKKELNIVGLNPADVVGRGKNHYLEHPDDSFEDIEKIEYKAMDLWMRLWTNAVESGEPGIFNLSLTNRFTNVSYFLKLAQTNPCHSGNSYLLTNNGFKKIRDLYESEDELNIVQDTRVTYIGPEKDDNEPSYWNVSNGESSFEVNSASKVYLTKKNAKVVKIETVGGLDCVVTPDHHMATTRGMIRADKLKLTDKILVGNTRLFTESNVERSSKDYKIGYLYGLLVGDGHLNTDHNSAVALQFWGKDLDECSKVNDIALELFNESVDDLKNWSENNSTRKIHHGSIFPLTKRKSLIFQSTFLKRLFQSYGLLSDLNKMNIPDEILNNKNFLVGMLSGLFFTDGTVNSGNRSQFSLRVGSVYKEFLQKLQLKLLEFGIFGRIYLRKKACIKLMSNGIGPSKEYNCKDYFEIIFDGLARDLFYKLVELKTYKKLKYDGLNSLKSNTTNTGNWYAKVLSVSDHGEEDVFCLTENIRRTMNVNGTMSRRCGEIPLESYANCCLGHINLVNMLNPESTDVDWRKLARTIRAGVRFLDNVLTANHYPIPECKIAGERSRRIGLGTLGLHHMLIKLNIKYGSDKCLEFLDRLYATIKNEAYLASTYIAKEKGSFPEFDSKKFLQEEFAKELPARIRMLIKDNGIRNALLLTAAPTGTISMVHGTSTGIEPIFAPMYKRRFREGNTWRETIVLDPLFKDALANDKDVSCYVGAYDVTPEEHMAVQAVCQRHIDNAISKTINLPNDANKDSETIAKLALKYANYLKGITVYRAGSRGMEPLEAMPLNEENIAIAKQLILEEKAESEMAGQSCTVGGECGS